MTPVIEHATIGSHEVRFTYDGESHNWSFRVPSLNIVGGGETREEAEKTAIDAIQFALHDGNEKVRAWTLLIGIGLIGALAPAVIRAIGNTIKRAATLR